ncbi:hypothetical protein F4777DRAFT_548955 [Nemania sp. FL0916]|nr:hypothetical protein F4777DRAFT_548955 [Nemania sp. FL0916]
MSRLPSSTLRPAGTRRRSSSTPAGPRTPLPSPRSEIGSLCDIIHENAGESLLVRPLFWTDRHTELLNCRFAEVPHTAHDPLSPSSLPSSQLSSPPSSPAPQRSLQWALQLFPSLPSAIRVIMSKDYSKPKKGRYRAMATLIGELYPNTLQTPPLNPATLDFSYGETSWKGAVSCPMMWNSKLEKFDGKNWNLDFCVGPALAYINPDEVDYMRRMSFLVACGPKGQPNHALHALHSRLLKRMVPKNDYEDAYFLAILVAMAQELHQNLYRHHDADVRLISAVPEEKVFVVYSATIPASFVARFNCPTEVPIGDPKITVNYTKVPVYPLPGLKDRLDNALGRHWVSPVDHSSPNDRLGAAVVPTELATPEPAAASKRGREALTEVVNVSSSDDLNLRPQKRQRVKK